MKQQQSKRTGLKSKHTRIYLTAYKVIVIEKKYNNLMYAKWECQTVMKEMGYTPAQASMMVRNGDSRINQAYWLEHPDIQIYDLCEHVGKMRIGGLIEYIDKALMLPAEHCDDYPLPA
jgi:hypothetical protein